MEVHHLWGTLLHQRYMMQGDRKAALDALNHYNLAADLGADRPRYWCSPRPARHAASGLGQSPIGVAGPGGARPVAVYFFGVHLNLQVALARSFYHVGEPP